MITLEVNEQNVKINLLELLTLKVVPVVLSDIEDVSTATCAKCAVTSSCLDVCIFLRCRPYEREDASYAYFIRGETNSESL